MSKPTTYFVQMPQIDQLVERFGSQLDASALQDKLLLRIVLSQYSFGVRYSPTDYAMEQAVLDCGVADVDGNPSYPMVDADALAESLTILSGIPAPIVDALLDAINAQIRSHAFA